MFKNIKMEHTMCVSSSISSQMIITVTWNQFFDAYSTYRQNDNISSSSSSPLSSPPTPHLCPCHQHLIIIITLIPIITHVNLYYPFHRLPSKIIKRSSNSYSKDTKTPLRGMKSKTPVPIPVDEID